jgi:hypothetical protein
VNYEQIAANWINGNCEDALTALEALEPAGVAVFMAEARACGINPNDLNRIVVRLQNRLYERNRWPETIEVRAKKKDDGFVYGVATNGTEVTYGTAYGLLRDRGVAVGEAEAKLAKAEREAHPW